MFYAQSLCRRWAPLCRPLLSADVPRSAWCCQRMRCALVLLSFSADAGHAWTAASTITCTPSYPWRTHSLVTHKLHIRFHVASLRAPRRNQSQHCCATLAVLPVPPKPVFFLLAFVHHAYIQALPGFGGGGCSCRARAFAVLCFIQGTVLCRAACGLYGYGPTLCCCLAGLCAGLVLLRPPDVSPWLCVECGCASCAAVSTSPVSRACQQAVFARCL
jgi:hypothetical protein